jgi:hypothetical protein
VDYLIRRHYTPLGRPLRACQPRDLLEQVAALSRYRGEEPTVTRELIDAACRTYFIDDMPPPPEAEKDGAAGPHPRLDVH